MSAGRDYSRASWRLKHARAKEHLDHLEVHLASYFNRHPYGPRRRHRGKPNPYVWCFSLNVIEEPDDQASLIFGDVVHNLRSALDHLASALTPCDSGRIAFPIEIANIWDTDESGNFVHKDSDARKRYLSNVEGMSFEVLAILNELQPYNARLAQRVSQVRPGQAPELHPLRVLGLFDNADKHRELVRLNFAMMGAVSLMFIRGQLAHFWNIAHCHHSAEIAYYPHPPFDNPSESEVEVRIFGTEIVTAEIALKDGMIPVI